MSRHRITPDMLKAVLNGICPECNQKVRDWRPPSGAFAPEVYATLREQGIEPSTGHVAGCDYDLMAPDVTNEG